MRYKPKNIIQFLIISKLKCLYFIQNTYKYSNIFANKLKEKDYLGEMSNHSSKYQSKVVIACKSSSSLKSKTYSNKIKHNSSLPCDHKLFTKEHCLACFNANTNQRLSIHRKKTSQCLTVRMQSKHLFNKTNQKTVAFTQNYITLNSSMYLMIRVSKTHNLVKHFNNKNLQPLFFDFLHFLSHEENN